MLRKYLDGNFIVEFSFKVSANDSSQHIMELYLLFYWNLTQQFGIPKIETYKYRNLMEKLLDMTLFQNNATNLQRFFPDGVMVENLICDWVLLSSQRFKR